MKVKLIITSQGKPRKKRKYTREEVIAWSKRGPKDLPSTLAWDISK